MSALNNTILLASKNEFVKAIVEKWAVENNKRIYYFNEKEDFANVPAQMIIMEYWLESAFAMGYYFDYCMEVNTNSNHFDTLDWAPFIIVHRDFKVPRETIAKDLNKPDSRVSIIKDFEEENYDEKALVRELDNYNHLLKHESMMIENGKRRISYSCNIGKGTSSKSQLCIDGREDLISQLLEKGCKNVVFKYHCILDEIARFNSETIKTEEITQDLLNWLHRSDFGTSKFIEKA